MKKSLSISIAFTLITVIGSLLPLISSSVFIWIYDGPKPTFNGLTGLGEITIICIPITIGALFSLYNNRTHHSGFRFQDLVFWVSLITLFFALGIYSYGIKEFNIDRSPRNNLIVFSYVFLIWTVIATFTAKFIESKHFSAYQSRQEDQDNLERRFNQL